MHNPSVVNPVNLLTSTGPGLKPASNAGVTPAVPFQQVLTREVGQRQAPATPEKAPAPHSENAAPATRQQGARAPESKAAKSADKTATKQTEAAKQDELAQENQETTPGSELLALVANLVQAAGKPEDKVKTDKDDAHDAGQDQQLMPGAGAINMTLDGAARKAAPADGVSGITAADGKLQRADASMLAADGSLADSSAADAHGKAEAGKKGGREVDLAGKLSADDIAARGALQQKADARFSFNEASLKAQENVQAQAATALARDSARLSADAALAPVQQAALSLTQAANASEKLTPAVGNPAWDQALGQKIVWMVAGGEQSASLTLNPPDLGPLQVVLNVSNDQANATFIAAQPEVREALEAALPKLRDMMSEAGIQLGQANVSAQAQGQQQAGEQQQRQGQPRFAQSVSSQAEAAVAQAAPRAPARSGTLGVVDTFA